METPETSSPLPEVENQKQYYSLGEMREIKATFKNLNNWEVIFPIMVLYNSTSLTLQ